MSSIEDELREETLILIQQNRQIAAELDEAIRNQKRDWLIDFVQSVAGEERSVSAPVIQSVVDWLFDIFS
ncbi:hypothetical protein [Dictyobacter aurantiacus]|uniref:Uncharacterized protein n=1 Tax=Dictyobacter aurantiacus TaxID=1936993 RepID=A0A401ZSB2_9CHLR|nr:hypothetical protein [Dictyobacter aurantiacus]GCE09779.1 hypothetical protein KDAU_71080 [Dictyobacter aurantiacus]